eukprot:gene6365-12867_t
MRESYRKIRNLKQSHETQRYQLELSIETTPRDSRYSQVLVDMMQKEEAQSVEGRATPELSKKVDDALHTETSAFFGRVAQLNVKRWAVLSNKLDHEREAYRAELMRTFKESKTDDTLYSPTSVDEGEIDPIAMEALRLDHIYNEHWYQFEGFNLEEAFRSQRTRIETEWEVHRNTLSDSFRQRRKSLLGSSDSSDNPSATATVQDERWHHPEKQKTLIHTAPVMSPSTSTSNNGSSSPEKGRAVGSGVRAVRSRGSDGSPAHVQVELDNLELEYRKSLEAMDKQKTNATRWMMRQRVRLVAQAEVIQQERRAIASIIGKELDDIASLMRMANGGSMAVATTIGTATGGMGGGSGGGGGVNTTSITTTRGELSGRQSQGTTGKTGVISMSARGGGR